MLILLPVCRRSLECPLAFRHEICACRDLKWAGLGYEPSELVSQVGSYFATTQKLKSHVKCVRIETFDI